MDDFCNTIAALNGSDHAVLKRSKMKIVKICAVLKASASTAIATICKLLSEKAADGKTMRAEYDCDAAVRLFFEQQVNACGECCAAIDSMVRCLRGTNSDCFLCPSMAARNGNVKPPYCYFASKMQHKWRRETDIALCLKSTTLVHHAGTIWK